LGGQAPAFVEARHRLGWHPLGVGAGDDSIPHAAERRALAGSADTRISADALVD
jgi:hypothetical protein